MKEIIIKELADKTGLKKEEIENLIEIPPSPELGDLAFPCFSLSKKFRLPPNKIAEELAKKISSKKFKVKQAGPYLNFFINPQELGKAVLKINSNFGKSNLGKNRKILIDFSGPNIGKPMHIGHIRSTILGDSLMRIYKFLNYNPIGINYLGDVGLHIGKLIVAYELWLDKKALRENPVNELLRLYVKFNEKEGFNKDSKNPEELEENEWTEKAKEKLKLLELGDKKTLKIWEDIRKASKKGFDKIYKILNINFHETTGQSYFAETGKKLVLEALKKGIAKKEGNAVYIEIKKNNKIQKKYILRSNETASYITYDIGAAYERAKKYRNFEKMIYVTDFRQKEHFESLFYFLKLMKFDFADKLIHLPFGTIKFGDEIVATRKGNVILLEDVIKKTTEKAREIVEKSGKSKTNYEKVAISSIKYAVLKNEPIKDVKFNFEKALNFEGNSGPYLLYSYARASSIIRKSNKKQKPEIKDLEKAEIELIKQILKFPDVVKQAGKNMNPSVIANFSYELSKKFSEFYHSCPVLNSKNENFRIELVEAFRTTLKNSLYLIGIEVVEEM